MKTLILMYLLAIGLQETFGQIKTVTGIGLKEGTLDTLPYLIDGDPDTCMDSGPLVGKPAVQIDLGETMIVEGIKLVFAKDCKNSLTKTGCAFHKTVVDVRDDANSEGQRCLTVSSWANRDELTMKCRDGALMGRYVTLTKQKTLFAKRAIYLCEMEVNTASTNSLALGKTVTGIRLEAGALDTLPNLVDGDANTCFDSGPLVDIPAVQIDLGVPMIIEAFKLVFPANCKNTMSGWGCSYHKTVVNVGNEANGEGQQCAFIDVGVVKGELISVCEDGPLTGRYVTLIKQKTPAKRSIHLCEMEVYGVAPVIEPPPPPPPPPPPVTEAPPPPPPEGTTIPTTLACEFPPNLVNVALGKSASQSSVKAKFEGTADKALDGNKNTDIKVGKSCTHTEKEFQPWWMVDLGQSKDIYKVIITNRQDCCPFRIKNAQVRVGDSPNMEENPVCGNMVLGKRVRQETITVACGCEIPMTGRYVSIQLIDKTQFLHMCEVEVMAL
ncbi:uncharacterized protein [Ptychodera flava]|uniref:uncharacterized protein n=1 Tax=Ptychodera flava TaxID=63121 RepID=UPI00396A5AD6